MTQLQGLQGDLWRKLGATLQAKRRHLTHMMVKSKDSGDFPGGPVVKIPLFHCRGHGMGLIPGWGTKILHALW